MLSPLGESLVVESSVVFDVAASPEFLRDTANNASADANSAIVAELLIGGAVGGVLLVDDFATAGMTTSGVGIISTATSTTRNVPSGAMPFNCAV